MRSRIFSRTAPADYISAMNGLSGFIAIILFVSGSLAVGSLFVMLSVLLDGLDGIIARRYGSSHKKGPQIDSVADTISFCIAPATALYSALSPSSESYSPFIFLVMATSSLLVFTGIVRLGTFCDTGYEMEHFSGLPTPAVAIFLTSLLLLSKIGNLSPYIEISSAFILSVLMVIRVPYPKMRGKNAYISAIPIILFMLSILLSFMEVFFSALLLGSALFYILAGPLLMDRFSSP